MKFYVYEHPVEDNIQLPDVIKYHGIVNFPKNLRDFFDMEKIMPHLSKILKKLNVSDTSDVGFDGAENFSYFFQDDNGRDFALEFVIHEDSEEEYYKMFDEDEVEAEASGEIIEYENKYGSLELETVSEYKKVGEIRSKDLDPSLFFDIETAEQIALITGNKGIQLSVTYLPGKMFVIHHASSDIAAVCKVKSILFNDDDFNAREELAKPRPYHPFWS